MYCYSYVTVAADFSPCQIVNKMVDLCAFTTNRSTWSDLDRYKQERIDFTIISLPHAVLPVSCVILSRARQSHSGLLAHAVDISGMGVSAIRHVIPFLTVFTASRWPKVMFFC